MCKGSSAEKRLLSQQVRQVSRRYKSISYFWEHARKNRPGFCKTKELKYGFCSETLMTEASQASVRHKTVCRAFSFFAVFLMRGLGITTVSLLSFTLPQFPFSVNPGYKVCHLQAGELPSAMEPFCTAHHSLFLKNTREEKHQLTPFSFLDFPFVQAMQCKCLSRIIKENHVALIYELFSRPLKMHPFCFCCISRHNVCCPT